MAIQHSYVTGNAAVLTAELQTLEDNAEMYDEDCIKPTPDAFSYLRELLAASPGYMHSLSPAGVVYPDGSGTL